jgi:hypothetical protein
MVAISSRSRSGSPGIGAVRARMSSHFSVAVSGAIGSVMSGMSAGTPGFIASQSSSLPTNSSFDSLCSRM